MTIPAEIRSGVLRFTGYLIPLIQSLPALGSWMGLMTLPFAIYLIAFFTNLPGSLVDIFSAFFTLFPLLILERVFIIVGLLLLAYSIVYLRMKRNEGIVTSGPYGVVRHPQYFGVILSTLGLTSWSVWILNSTFGVGFLSATQTTVVWFLELFAYIFLAFVEELFLARNHGDVFDQYRNTVPFFIPFFKPSRNGLGLLVSIIIPSVLLFVLIYIGI